MDPSWLLDTFYELNHGTNSWTFKPWMPVRSYRFCLLADEEEGRLLMLPGGPDQAHSKYKLSIAVFEKGIKNDWS